MAEQNGTATTEPKGTVIRLEYAAGDATVIPSSPGFLLVFDTPGMHLSVPLSPGDSDELVHALRTERLRAAEPRAVA